MSKHKSDWLLCLALMLEIIAIGVLVPGDWTGRVINKEKQMIQNQLGAQTSYWIGQTSHRWYQSWIVDTQMEQSVRDFLIPTEEQRLRSKGMENMGGFWFVWVEDRIQAFFDVLYQVFTRFALLMVWLPFALILMLPALWDGLMTWKIKKTTFDFSSPIIHRYSMIILGSGVILLFMGLFAPLAIPPVVLPSLIIGLALMAGLALSHLQKKI